MKQFFTICIALILVLCMCSCAASKGTPPQEEDIRAICELATLKCYYNNVAKLEKNKDNIFQKDRKMWIEYEGEATIGIDMSKVEIKITGDAVHITLPEAEILSIKPLQETLTEGSYVSSSDGWLIKNEFTLEDQRQAIVLGQEEMEEAVKGNTSLFRQAEDQAKELISNYIAQIGEITGTDYQITWKTK